MIVATEAPANAEAQVPLGHVEIRGAGPIPMVLISGPTLDWRYWEEFMNRNSEAYTMYAVTLPGMSGSPSMPMPSDWRPKEREDRKKPPLDTPWLDNAVDAIVDMMIEEETGRAVIMGHAMGGLLAIRMGIEHPTMVSSVVTLEGTVAFPTPRPLTKNERAADALWRFDQSLRSISPEDWPGQMASWTRTGTSSEEIAEFVTRLSLDTEQDVCIRYLVEHRMTDLTDQMDKLRAPTLGIFSAIVGEDGLKHDKKKKAQFGPAWHEEIRFYDMNEISFFYTLQDPERFGTEIADFIKAQNITGAQDN
jgi:pimeloyl-ACP methyl ester carboxylesterase